MFEVIDISCDVKYADSVFEVDSLCFKDEGWSLELLKRDLNDRKYIFLLCKSGEEVVGFCVALVVQGDGELLKIGVKPEFRENGVAQMLMTALKDILISRNCHMLMLEVRSQNNAAIALYNKNGFAKDYIRKKYYQNPSDDAIMMSVKL